MNCRYKRFQKATGGDKETPGMGSLLEKEGYILKNQMLYQVKGGIETLMARPHEAESYDTSPFYPMVRTSRETQNPCQSW